MPDSAAKLAEAYERGRQAAVVIFDDKAQIVFASDEAKRLLQRPLGLAGLDWPKAGTFTDADGNELPPDQYPIMRAMRSGQPVTETLYYRRGDGFCAWLEVAAIGSSFGGALTVRVVDRPAQGKRRSEAA